MLGQILIIVTSGDELAKNLCSATSGNLALRFNVWDRILFSFEMLELYRLAS